MIYVYTIQCSTKTWQCLSVLNLPQGKHYFFWHKSSDFLCCAAPVVSPLSHQKKRPPGCSTLLRFICSVYLLLHLSKTRWWFNFITCQLCQIKQVHEGKIWMRLPCTENQNISNQQKHWSLIGHRTISESIRVSCKLIWSKSNHLQLDHKNWDYHGVQFFFQSTGFVKNTYSDSNIPRHPPFFFPSQKMPGCTGHPTVSQSSSQQTFLCRHVGQYCRPFTGTTHGQDQPVPSLKHCSPPWKSITRHQR